MSCTPFVYLKKICSQGSILKCEIEVPGVPQCVVPFKFDGGENGQELVYGTLNGKIGHVMLTEYVICF